MTKKTTKKKKKTERIWLNSYPPAVSAEIGELEYSSVAHLLEEPFIITLATKVVILSLAGVGLNLALGHGGLVSLGHAAFFGLGGYAMGILASHAQSFEPIMIGSKLWA